MASQPTFLPNIKCYIGGSFDPVHLGHICMAQYLIASIQACAEKAGQPISASIHFLPTAGSPLKNTQTTIADRLAMLKLAIATLAHGLPKATLCTDIDTLVDKDSHGNHGIALTIDTRELEKTPPVYSIDTFTKIQTENPNTSIIFVMGKDSVASLPKWKDGEKLLNFCHFWVFNRITETSVHKINCINTDRLSEDFINSVPYDLKSRLLKTPENLLTSHSGSIFLDTRCPPAISSSQVRQLVASNCHTNDIKKLVTLGVWEYIKNKQLYRT